MYLFTYGTLMFADVWRRVGLGDFPSENARLRGYAVYRVQRALYPGLVRTNNIVDEVPGRLYSQLDEQAVRCLDAYESEMYNRVVVSVTRDDGSAVDCFVYVWPEARRHRLTDEPWDPGWFERHELAQYLRDR